MGLQLLLLLPFDIDLSLKLLLNMPCALHSAFNGFDDGGLIALRALQIHQVTSTPRYNFDNIEPPCSGYYTKCSDVAGKMDLFSLYFCHCTLLDISQVYSLQ